MGSYGRDDRSGGRSSFGGGRSFGGGNRGGFGGGRGGFDRSNDRGNREMFSATCSNCGKECQVPFRPTNGKPVYCSDCFEKMGNGGHTDAPRFERPAFNSRPAEGGNKAQLDVLSAKLDKIIKLLESKAVAVSEGPELVSGSTEDKPVEAKKASKAKKATSKKTK